MQPEIIIAILSLLVCYVRIQGQLYHTEFYSGITMITAYEECLPDTQFNAESHIDCGIRCHSTVHPRQIAGFTYSSDTRCYCWPIPSGIPPGTGGGRAYIRGSHAPGRWAY